MSVPLAWLLHNLGVIALIGYLCWLFSSGWPCLLVFVMVGLSRGKKEDS